MYIYVRIFIAYRVKFKTKNGSGVKNRERCDVMRLSLISKVPREKRKHDWNSWLYPAISSTIVRTPIGTSRTLPAYFSPFSGRCERGPRLLLIVSSNRELKGNGRSILFLYRGSQGRRTNVHWTGTLSCILYILNRVRLNSRYSLLSKSMSDHPTV